MAQGHVMDTIEKTSPNLRYLQPPLLLRNESGRFVRVIAGAAFEQDWAGRGAAFGDLDNDGDTRRGRQQRRAEGDACCAMTAGTAGTGSASEPSARARTATASAAGSRSCRRPGRRSTSRHDHCRLPVGQRQAAAGRSRRATSPRSWSRSAGRRGSSRRSRTSSGQTLVATEPAGPASPSRAAERAAPPMMTRRSMLALLACSADAAFGQGISSRGVKPHPRGKPSGRPFVARFTDVAERAGLTQPVVYGGTDSKSYIIEVVGCGVAFLDYDNDGWLDLFVLSGTRLEGAPPGTTNRLYKNNRDGTFTDVTERAGLTRTGWASAVTVGDYDNDGFDDLFITYYGHNALYHNNGDGTFTDVTEKAGPARGRRAVWLGVHLGRLRSRRPARSVRRHLPRHHAREAAEARGELRLPLEGRAGQLWSSRPAYRVRPAVSQQRRWDVHRREPAIGRRGGRRFLPHDRRVRGLRQRRLAGHLRRMRLDAELALPQPARRHVSRGGTGARCGAQRGRVGAGGNGPGRRRLRSRRQPGHLQDALRGRHERPVPERRQGEFRRRHDSGGDRRGDALRRAGGPGWPTWTTTAFPTCSW